ncbi:MAG: metallophosphoesterase [Fibrobacteria bacterium]|nr:metallophosphoesterase [Fibrobacteria bacterium]
MKVVLIVVVIFSSLVGELFAKPWKFGVMGDTQGGKILKAGNTYGPGDSTCGNGVPAGIIDQVYDKMIAAKVKFVCTVGDNGDADGTATPRTVATYVQKLYNHGIGFYPIRGNHESSAAAGNETKRVFPQTKDGINNATPEDGTLDSVMYNYSKVWRGVDDFTFYPTPEPKQGDTFSVGSHFTMLNVNGGIVYAFNYENARFVMIDNLYQSNLSAANLLPWIETQLFNNKNGANHAFVFNHVPLWGQKRPWGLMSAAPNQNISDQDSFISKVMGGGTDYYFAGHEHMHYRTIKANSGGNKRINEIITQSLSWKFNKPVTPSIAEQYGQTSRETFVSWHNRAVGYYILTIDETDVMVDYYGLPVVLDPASDEEKYLFATPNIRDSIRLWERFGFGKGAGAKNFAKTPGDSYTNITHTYQGTTFKILSGSVTNSGKSHNNKSLTQQIGLSLRDTSYRATGDPAMSSNIAMLVGMMMNARTPTITVSMNFPFGLDTLDSLSGILSENDSGQWVHAVDLNNGGEKKFVKGAWKATYALGTYGIDETAKTAWAVINSNGRYAVGRVTPDSVPDTTVVFSKNTKASAKPQMVTVIGNSLVFPQQFKGKNIRCNLYNLHGSLELMKDTREGVIHFTNKNMKGIYIVRWNSEGVNRMQKVMF